MYYYSNELYHFGINGMKWGTRRYQNPDGTLTEEGKLRYGRDVTKLSGHALRRQVGRADRAGRMKNLYEAERQTRADQKSTREYRQYQKAQEELRKIRTMVSAINGPDADFELDYESQQHYDRISQKYMDKCREISKKASCFLCRSYSERSRLRYY